MGLSILHTDGIRLGAKEQTYIYWWSDRRFEVLLCR
jgi:hypothetical protein